MAQRKILIATAYEKWGLSMLRKLQQNYTQDIVVINGPTNMLITNPRLWKDAIKEFQSHTHIIIIPYTLLPKSDEEMFEAIPIMLEEGRMIRAFEFLMAYTKKQPAMIELKNTSKDDNWRLIVNFLSGIIIPK